MPSTTKTTATSRIRGAIAVGPTCYCKPCNKQQWWQNITKPPNRGAKAVKPLQILHRWRRQPHQLETGAVNDISNINSSSSFSSSTIRRGSVIASRSSTTPKGERPVKPGDRPVLPRKKVLRPYCEESAHDRIGRCAQWFILSFDSWHSHMFTHLHVLVAFSQYTVVNVLVWGLSLRGIGVLNRWFFVLVY